MPVLEKWGESQQTERNYKAAQSAHVYCDLRGGIRIGAFY